MIGRLFLPAHLVTPQYPEPRTGPQFIVPVTFSELAGRQATIDDVWSALRFVDRTLAITNLCIILNGVERFQHDRAMHTAFAEAFLRPEYRKTPPSLPSDKQPDYRYILNPQGVLLALELLLGSTATPPLDNGAPPMDQFLIGDLILLANDLGLASSLTAEGITEAALAAEFLPIWDLTNPGRVVYAMARVYRMIGVHLLGQDQRVTMLVSGLGIRPAELTYGGISLDEYMFVVFALHARGQQIRGPAVLSNPDLAVFDSGSLLKQTTFPQPRFADFLLNMSVPVDAARRKLAGGDGGWDKGRLSQILDSPTFRTDFLAFREQPLLNVKENQYLAIDEHFLADLLSIGMLFQIRAKLPPKKGSMFMSLLGRLFELYGAELLEYFYPGGSGLLRVDVAYEGGQVDALLDFGEYVVIIEFKFFLLSHEIRHKRESGALEQSLREKLVENERGERKAARQLAHAAAAIQNGKLTAARARPAIYPVVVIYESGLQVPGANALVDGYFREYRAAIPEEHLVRPLTVMSVEELEGLLAQTAGARTSWREVLEARFDRDQVRFTSVHQAIYDILNARKLAATNNEFLKSTFDGIADKFRGYFPREPEGPPIATERSKAG